jgi:hypothetical protein
MNPTVMAAAIGVGGTVIIGLAGFGAAVWNTRKILADARENRFWEKQTVAYEEALAELANRRVRRERVIRKLDTTSKRTEVLEEYFAERDTPAWFSAEAMLLAYSSKRVRDALDNARSADRAASESLDKFQLTWRAAGIGEFRSSPERAPALEKAESVLHETEVALTKGNASDQALIDVIRAELQGAHEKNDS